MIKYRISVKVYGAGINLHFDVYCNNVKVAKKKIYKQVAKMLDDFFPIADLEEDNDISIMLEIYKNYSICIGSAIVDGSYIDGKFTYDKNSEVDYLWGV